jgi:hypothetical protein
MSNSTSTNKGLYLQSMTYSRYGGIGEGNGSMHFQNSGISLSIALKSEDVAELKALAFKIFERNRQQLSNDILKVETPLLLGSSKVMDAEFEERPSGEEQEISF